MAARRPFQRACDVFSWRGRLDPFCTAGARNRRPSRWGYVVDLNGAWVLPGLINAHDHLELNHYGRHHAGAPYRNIQQWVDDMRIRLREDPVIVNGRAQSLAARVWLGGFESAGGCDPGGPSQSGLSRFASRDARASAPSIRMGPFICDAATARRGAGRTWRRCARSIPPDAAFRAFCVAPGRRGGRRCLTGTAAPGGRRRPRREPCWCMASRSRATDGASWHSAVRVPSGVRPQPRPVRDHDGSAPCAARLAGSRPLGRIRG